MTNRSAVHRTVVRHTPRDQHAWMRNGLAGLLILTVLVGVATVLLGWWIVPFNFTIGLTVLFGVPIISELWRTRPTPQQAMHNDDVIKDFERHFHGL